jgi:hypothetical protein
MLDNKHPCNIGLNYQLNDRTGEGKERIEETTSA